MLSWLRRKFTNATPAKLIGSPAPVMSRSGAWIDRGVTVDHIADYYKIPKVLSSIGTLSQIAFPGFDFKLLPLEEGDDTQGDKIDDALREMKLIDRRMGTVGKSQAVGTIGLVRRTFLDIVGYRCAVFEYSMKQDGSWLVPEVVQWLPAKSFSAAPQEAMGNDLMQSDTLLKGIIFDAREMRTRYYQSQDRSGRPVEIPGEQVLFIEDANTVDTSILASIGPSIEQWKALRHNLMIAMHRVGAPNEVAQIDVEAFAKAAEAGSSLSFNDVIAYAKDLIQSQGTETAKVSMPGMRLEYPDISMPINPLEPDQYLKREILEHFFPRDFLEVTAQAVSASNSQLKFLLDQMTASHRETNGRPWEQWWSDWLQLNGFELRCEFDWWDITPDDAEAFHTKLLQDYRSHAISLNEFREKMGYKVLDDSEIDALIDQHNRIWAKQQGGNSLTQSDITV